MIVQHRQRVHGKKAAVGRTGRKGTPNCPENNSKGISRKVCLSIAISLMRTISFFRLCSIDIDTQAQARLGDPSVTYVPSSPSKSYVTREMRGDKKSSPNLSKVNNRLDFSF